MRVVVVSIVLAAVAALVCVVPPAEAKKDPAAVARKKAVKAASKAAKRIAKSVKKQVTLEARAAAGTIGALTKAASRGTNIEQLSGVPSDGSGAVSDAQRQGLISGFVNSLANYHGKTLSIIESAYGTVEVDPALLSAGETSGVADSAAGTSGLAHEFARFMEEIWGGGNATVDRAAAKFQDAVTDDGFGFVYVNGGVPRLTAPKLSGDAGQPLASSRVLATCGTETGGTSVVIGASEDPVVSEEGFVVALVDADGNVISNLGTPARDDRVFVYASTDSTLTDTCMEVVLQIPQGGFVPSDPVILILPEDLPAPGDGDGGGGGAPDGSGTSEDPFSIPRHAGGCNRIDDSLNPLVGIDFLAVGGDESLVRLPADALLVFRQTLFLDAPGSAIVETRINGKTVFDGGVIAESRFGFIDDLILTFEKSGKACVEIRINGELSSRVELPVD